MKKTFLFILFLIFFYSQEVSYSQQWKKYFGGNLDDKAYAITMDKSGYILVTGYISTTNQGTNFRTIKINPSTGSTVWTRDYNGPANQDDKSYAITVDSTGNVYVAGYSTGVGTGTDMTVIKYSSGGSLQWVGRYNSTINGNDEALAVAVDRSLNVYITGFVTLAGLDMYTAKYSSSGVYQWGRFNGGTANEDDKSYAITVDDLNNIYVGGYTTNISSGADFTLIKYTQSGERLWISYYDGPSHNDDIAVCMVQSEDKRIYLGGSSKKNSSPGSEDYMTVRFNPETGDTVWARRYGGSGNGEDKVYAITVDRLNNIIVTGSITAETSAGSPETVNLDYMTIRYNTEGDVVWQTAYDTNSRNETANALTVSNSGNYLFVTGSTRKGENPDSQDVVTVKYNLLTGEQMQASIINGPGNGEDNALGICADSDNDVFIAGYMKTVNSGLDWFTAKFQGGNLIDVKNISSNVPKNFVLHQNYPNPFNPSTSIRFDLPEAGHIKLVVYDMLGKQIEVLVNERLRSGTYEVNYTTVNLSSGVYFYELTADNFRDVKKMILIK